MKFVGYLLVFVGGCIVGNAVDYHSHLLSLMGMSLLVIGCFVAWYEERT